MTTAEASAARPRWERRKQARPSELVAAALALFVEKGYAGTRLEDVAARAGVSKGTLYLYFANKEELFKAVVRENIVRNIAQAQQMVSAYEGDTGALLAHLMREWWRRIGDTPASGIPKLVVSESGNFPQIARFYFDEVIDPVHDYAELMQTLFWSIGTWQLSRMVSTTWPPVSARMRVMW